MRKKIQAVLAALALFIMTVADASCSKCNQENNKSNFMDCLCSLAELGAKRKVIVYVNNNDSGLAFNCTPVGSLDCPYTNIAEAVNLSPEGAIIRVVFTGYAYTISSAIQLKPRQVLEGWNLGSTTTHPTIAIASSLLRGIILANHVRVSNFIITGTATTNQIGIDSNGANQATVSNNTFSNLYTSIYLVPVGGTKTSIIGNAFKRVVAYGVYTNPYSVAKVGKSTKQAARLRTKTSSLYELIIQDNTFTAPHGNMPIAIDVTGVGKLTVLSNTVSNTDLVSGPGYYVGLAADVDFSESNMVVSSAKMAAPGTSLKVLNNDFTGLTGGNGVGTFSKMVITDNIFNCSTNGLNLASFLISLHGGATACVTGNAFTGCAGGAGFSVVAAESTGQALPCLQLTRNTASGNTANLDYDLNALSTNPPLHINATYETANSGVKAIGDLVVIEHCFQCGL